MSTILTLIKLQFKARIRLAKRSGWKSITKLVLAVAALLAVFGGFIAVYYLLAINFVDTPGTSGDLRQEFLIFTILGFQTLQTIFLIPMLVKTLDINNERNLLLKLPITPRQIFISKIVVAYLREIVFAIVILLPILIAYGIASNMHWGFYLYFPLMLIFVPVIPFFIATLLLYPVTKVVQLMRSRAILTSVGYLAGLVTVIFFYTRFISNIMYAILDSGEFQSALRDDSDSIRNLGRLFLPQWLFSNLMDSTWYTALWSFLAILASSAFFLTLSFFVAGANYKRTYMTERPMNAGLSRRSAFKQRKPLYATFKKDTLNIFRSSNYTFQFLLIVIIMPLLIFFSNRIAMFSSYQSFKNLFVHDEAGGMVFGVSLFVMLIILPLACSFAASNITREGYNLYHTKLIPQSFFRQLMIKTLIVFVPVFVAITISSALIMIPYYVDTFFEQRVPFMDAFYIFGTATFMAIGYICLGTYLDLRAPLSSQVAGGELSTSTPHINMIMVGGLVVGALVGLLSMLGAYATIFRAFGMDFIAMVASVGEHIQTIFLVFSILFGVGMALLLFLHGPRRYRRLEQ